LRKYKKLIPIIAVILVALGVNLEQFGIDLNALSGQGSSQSQTQVQNQVQTGSQNNNPSNNPSNNNRQTAPSHTADKSQTSSRPAKLPHWSSSNPEINLWHIFEGEINRKGKPTGFHSRPGGSDPENARVLSIKDRPNTAGVYTANIEVRDGGQWKPKFSSFFPDSLSQQEVIDVILNAYKNSKNPNKQPWSGPSGYGFQVQGYTSSRGGINTAFPVYNRNQ